MRSFVVVLQRGAPITQLAERIRLPSSPDAEIKIEGHCALTAVSHRGGEKAIAREGAVCAVADSTEETESVLQAWLRWKEECVAHLAGDFSFAIWDGDAGQLFCARDPFGVRPFFYAQTADAFVCSDSLEAVLAHPSVSTALDDATVATYLETGGYDDEHSTVFANVRRLPPAHTLVVREGSAPTLRRYWTPTVQTIIAGSDAPQRLESALRASIGDRVRTKSAVVFLSGGLDSPALASIARESGTELLAFTSVYRTRMHDVEESFAAEAARSIGIAHRVFALDDYGPLHSLEHDAWRADPGALVTATASRDLHALAAQHAPLALHGHPADAVLASDPMVGLRALLRRPVALASALARYTMVKRRPPYFFVRRLLGSRRRADESAEPLAIRALRAPTWSSLFEWAHPLVTRAPIELTYPWADRRVVEAALSLEPIPWLVDKHVVRELLRGRVSERIRRRPKTTLQGDPRSGPLPARTLAIEAAARYIDPVRFREALERAASLDDNLVRALAFEHWLRQLSRRVEDLRRNI